MKNKLVLRLQEAAHAELLADINADFADILNGGDLHGQRPLAGGKDEPSWPTCRGWSSASTAAAWAACGS